MLLGILAIYSLLRKVEGILDKCFCLLNARLITG